MSTIQIVAFSFGAFLLLLLLVLVFWRRNLTSAEYTFARMAFALALACVAVVLTGFLEVKIKEFVQAGGALAVFVVAFFYAPAPLQGTNEWREVRALWRERRDLHDAPAQANADDVALALTAVNETAQLIADDDSLYAPFQRDYADDYCRLYGKLLKNRYPVPQSGATSDALLTPPAKSLAQRIPCPA